MRNSIIKTSIVNTIPYTFDLKGSRIKRRALPKKFEKFTSKQQKALVEQIMKDEDLTKFTRKMKPNLINITLTDRRKIIQSARNDVDFLESQGIMDYSLLLAVEEKHVHPTLLEVGEPPSIRKGS